LEKNERVTKQMDQLFYRFSGLVISIDTLLVALFFIGLFLIFTNRFYRLGRCLFGAIAVLLIVIAISPLPYWSAVYLENYFPRLQVVPSNVKGAILLGGNFDRPLSAKRGFTCHNIAAGRLIEGMELIQAYPHLKIIFTGGGAIIPGISSEAQMTYEIFKKVGIDTDRVIWEGASRNTLENATFTYKLLKPPIGEKWLLVTSAIHMPRAVGVFQKAGWDVIPYPVDYHTDGTIKLDLHFSLIHGLKAWMFSLNEWRGMIHNLLFGYTDHFLPPK
jgi:uncharacterized SAM-binding protein YcdF (DUF218 family)